MDKSFNDEELSDIMKEIEALEEDFKADDIEDPKIEASPLMEEFADLDEEVALPTPAARIEQSSVLPMTAKTPTTTTPATPAASTTAGPASMSFKVSGDINLELQFDIGGKVVSLNVSESGLNIEMEGGMSFKVPLSNTAHKKAA